MNHQRAVTILNELTRLPTAAGHEHRIMRWIENWVHHCMAQQPTLRLDTDPHGNRIVSCSHPSNSQSKPNPLYITAHLDHPAFVVTDVLSNRRIRAEFRGGVDKSYFINTPVTVFTSNEQPCPGRVTSIARQPKNIWSRFDVTITLDQPATDLTVGDIAVWKLPATSIQRSRDRVYAPVCDDLAAAAAAIVSYETLLKQNSPALAWTRLLFTRCEEVGFVGALGACENKTIPPHADVIALENSKAFSDAPIGAGPIIRVGDRTSIFHNALTYRITQIAEQHRKQTTRHKQPFQYQRKLMPGGVCEATVFCDAGYRATCICLPLGNYHNMNQRTGKIAREVISLSDYHQLVDLLINIATQHHHENPPRLSERLDELWKQRRVLLQGSAAIAV